ncbi:MAG: SufD family Fe-S cluster assembly protein [Solobacterium sp.]|nr:SufD family Fe-S cluster assembly protein [Solobacterium sp.]
MILDKNSEQTLQNGYTEYEVSTDEKELNLTFYALGESEVFIRITKAKKLLIHTIAEKHAHVTYLFWNEADYPISFEESHQVKKGAVLNIAYGEIMQNETTHNLTVDLEEENAAVYLSSATLTSVKKHFDMKVSSKAPHTFGQMRNFSVVLNGGDYYMNAVGSIEYGAIGAESHQTSRALCFDSEMNAKIIPVLLIDENDVKASHATSVGRVDEDQLYYLQSRGLSPQQCTALISTGYLLPVTEVIHDEKLKETLKNELEEKISQLCSM